MSVHIRVFPLMIYEHMHSDNYQVSSILEEKHKGRLLLFSIIEEKNDCL